MDKQVMYAPRDEKNPWRVDAFMTVNEWKEVTRWYTFSLRSLMPDGHWFEWSRSKTRNEAYQIMRALAVAKPRDYFVIVQCMLTGNDGRVKFVVCFPGTEERLLQERQERIKLG